MQIYSLHVFSQYFCSGKHSQVFLWPTDGSSEVPQHSQNPLSSSLLGFSVFSPLCSAVHRCSQIWQALSRHLHFYHISFWSRWCLHLRVLLHLCLSLWPGSGGWGFIKNINDWKKLLLGSAWMSYGWEPLCVLHWASTRQEVKKKTEFNETAKMRRLI